VGDNRWSGMGKWSHCIAESCRRQGHQVSLWFADRFPRLQRSGRASVLLFPLALALHLWRHRREFDVVVVHEPSGYWYGQLRRVLRSLPPMVAMSHGVESRRFQLLLDADRVGYASVSGTGRVKPRLMRLWQSDGTLRRADHVICLSSFDREHVASLGQRPDRVSLMINGVTDDHFRERSSERFAGRVLFVAGWLDAKGSFTLPRLWARVRERHPEARLTLVGTGAPADVVRSAFAPADCDSLEVIPRLTDAREMIEQFASHDLFLMPSLNEGSPLALLEAMAAGLPVVAGRAGGIPDIVAHERSGLLFDPLDPAAGAEQVCRMLEDAALRRSLAEAGQRRARELTWDQAAAVLELAAARALGSNAPALTRSTAA
jgi:glycosyltransferase involved in cell wall biosynthesis